MKRPRESLNRRAGGSLLRIARMVRKELRQLLRDPRSKRIIFLAPVVQLLLFGYAVTTDVRNVSLAVLDGDRSSQSRELVDAFTASGYFREVLAAESGRDLERALDHGRARATLEIPVGFARGLDEGRGPVVHLLVDGTSSNTATVAQGYATRIVTEFSLRHGAPRPETAGIDLRTRAWFNPELSSRAYNVPAVMGMIVLIMSLLLTAMSVVRERELGTMDQLLVSPLSPGELILGKTLPVAAVAMVQLALVASVGLLWFGIPLQGSVLLLVAASLLFILAGLSFGLLVSTISRTQQEAFLSIFLLVLPAIVLSGLLYPIETMPPFFQWLTLANPLRHFLEIVRDLFLKGAGVADLWFQLTVLALMAWAGIWLAVNRFRASVS
jgi:ABC-2 type transport system permease protein